MDYFYQSFSLLLKGTTLSLSLLLLSGFILQAQTAYIPNAADGTYSVIDVSTATVTETITVAPDSTSCLRSIWAGVNGNKIWIGDDIADVVYVFNTGDNTPADTIATGISACD